MAAPGNPEANGSRVFCTAVFHLKWRYVVLALIFIAMKKAIHNDLEQLKAKLENQSGPE